MCQITKRPDICAAAAAAAAAGKHKESPRKLNFLSDSGTIKLLYKIKINKGIGRKIQSLICLDKTVVNKNQLLTKQTGAS
jgi:hypothetical protein